VPSAREIKGEELAKRDRQDRHLVTFFLKSGGGGGGTGGSAALHIIFYLLKIEQSMRARIEVKGDQSNPASGNCTEVIMQAADGI